MPAWRSCLVLSCIGFLTMRCLDRKRGKYSPAQRYLWRGQQHWEKEKGNHILSITPDTKQRAEKIRFLWQRGFLTRPPRVWPTRISSSSSSSSSSPPPSETFILWTVDRWALLHRYSLQQSGQRISVPLVRNPRPTSPIRHLVHLKQPGCHCRPSNAMNFGSSTPKELQGVVAYKNLDSEGPGLDLRDIARQI